MRTEMRAQLDSMIEEYRDMVARLDGMTADVAALTGTASSVDRCVTVTVGPRGELTDLTIDPMIASRLDPRTLAAKVLEAADRATTQARDRVRATMVEVFPERLRQLVGPDATLDIGGLLSQNPAGDNDANSVRGGR